MASRRLHDTHRVLLAWVLGSVALLARTALAESALTEQQRRDMVEQQIVPRGVEDRAVLRAMHTIPRHEFVPAAYRDRAYERLGQLSRAASGDGSRNR